MVRMGGASYLHWIVHSFLLFECVITVSSFVKPIPIGKSRLSLPIFTVPVLTHNYSSCVHGQCSVRFDKPPADNSDSLWSFRCFAIRLKFHNILCVGSAGNPVLHGSDFMPKFSGDLRNF